MPRIELIPLAAGDAPSPHALADDLSSVLRMDVIVHSLSVNIEHAYDASRRQYHSTRVLELMLERAPPGESRLLAMTACDLFIPVLTYVFGQAQLGRRGAVFSTHRLHNEYYGLAASAGLLHDRSLKEALHELGHTFGLRHCAEEPCAMNASTYVEDIDLKPAAYCLPCLEQIRGVQPD